MRKINIAIADDHIIVRDGIALLLKNSSEICISHLAENGQDLLHKIKASMQKPHVIIMDVDMPIMNGFIATKKILQLIPDCKIIFLTSHSSVHFIEKIIECKAHGYLSKSTDFETLILAIKTVYYRGYYLNEHSSFFTILKPSKMDLHEDNESSKIFLSDREIEIIRLICKEKTDKEIAQLMNISDLTAETYRKKIMKKLNVKKSIGIVVFAMNNNLN